MHDDRNRVAFEKARGRPSDIEVVYPARESWKALQNPWFLDATSAFPGTLEISVPLFPEGEGDLPSAAAGAYDAQWTRLAETIVAAGRGDSIVRIAWEFNLPSNRLCPASAATSYVSAWRHVRNALHAVSSKLTFDWCANAGPSQGGAPQDITLCYPGDDVVDFIGVDSYDWYPRVVDDASWNIHVNEQNGIGPLLQMAINHGKWFSLPEWGVLPADSASGDDPIFVEKMWQWLNANAAHIGYESYFNDSSPAGGGSIEPVVSAPRAAGRYRELW
jgi:hypothetical protein